MVKLVPMSEERFQSYYEQAVQGYAAEHVRSGHWEADTAYEKSKREFEALLPQGLQSPNQFLYVIQEEESATPVGTIWYALRPKGPSQVAFIYEITIDPEHRRKGYAQQTFQALEELVQAQGVSAIDLHVFGHNNPAIALYQKIGFQATNLLMSKTLGEPESPSKATV